MLPLPLSLPLPLLHDPGQHQRRDIIDLLSASLDATAAAVTKGRYLFTPAHFAATRGDVVSLGYLLAVMRDSGGVSDPCATVDKFNRTVADLAVHFGNVAPDTLVQLCGATSAAVTAGTHTVCKQRVDDTGLDAADADAATSLPPLTPSSSASARPTRQPVAEGHDSSVTNGWTEVSLSALEACGAPVTALLTSTVLRPLGRCDQPSRHWLLELTAEQLAADATVVEREMESVSRPGVVRGGLSVQGPSLRGQHWSKSALLARHGGLKVARWALCAT